MKNPDQSSLFTTAKQLLARNEAAAIVKIIEAAGSTPRDAGTIMLVTPSDFFGTIGGGQLEWIICKRTRDFLDHDGEREVIEIALGPEIGQCCGGKVIMELSKLNASNLSMIRTSETIKNPWRIQIHGAGHTGHALSNTLALLPFETEIVDVRAQALETIPKGVITHHCPMPETLVRQAQPDTAFVIFTHEHNLDFLIAAEALKRADAAYVGMIGSRTKRAVFKNWLSANGFDHGLETQLTSPIGGQAIKDKRPEIIAALVASELIGMFSSGK